jgi:Tol biopolymer transport system component
MKRAKPLVLFGLFLGLLLAGRVTVPAQQNPADEAYDLARLAWDTGDFVKALEGFAALLKGPEGGRFFEPIALLTGELFRTVEVTTDGRAVRLSPDGVYGAYETGARGAVMMKIFTLAEPAKTFMDIRGTNFIFSPIPKIGAYLKIPETPEIAKLRQEIEVLGGQPAPDRQALSNKQRELAYLEAKTAQIVLVDLATKKETVVKTEGFLKSGLAFSSDGKEIYFTGAKTTDEASNEIYAVSAAGGVRPLSAGPGFKSNPAAVPGGKFILYSPAADAPFPKPAAPAIKPATGATPISGQTPPGGGRPMGAPVGGRPGPVRQFALLNLVDKSTKTFTGTGPSVSADGGVLVFVGQDGTESTINLVKLSGDLAPAVIKKSAERIGSAALSPDGTGVVFDVPYTRNGEIFFIGVDGKNETRLSREIQPDRAPRFLDAGTVLAVKGESRHSRSYLYDLKTQTATRLFHNNMLRRIAQEYEWVADPSGRRIAIVAERDGDTITPDRGVYVIDRTKKIAPPDLLARLESSLAEEKSLRAWGERTYGPLRAAIQAAVDRVSITKIFDHETTLFDFDSKYITAPGNRKAAEYIFAQLRSFGYTPEYQEFESRGTKTANILARLPGTENPDLLYILSGHFDSNQRSPGADDDSSVTAVNLETARLLAQSSLPSTVVFAFFTGEEAGLLGSREFVRVAKEKGWKIAADINNDMIGWTNDHRLDDTIRWTSPGLRDIQHAAAFLFSRMITYDTRYVKSTDGQSFYDAYGDVVSGLGSYPVLGNPYYHQPTDLLETVNHQLLLEAAKYNTASIMMIASSPAPVRDLKVTVGKDGTAEASWAASPEKGIAGYLVEYGPAGDAAKFRVRTETPRLALQGLKLGKGEKAAVAVKALDRRGIESWDWTRI